MVKVTLGRNVWRHDNWKPAQHISVDFTLAQARYTTSQPTDVIAHVLNVYRSAFGMAYGRNEEHVSAWEPFKDQQTLIDDVLNPIVNVWGDFLVYVGGDKPYTVVSVNRCSEYTSTEDIGNAIDTLLTAYDIKEGDIADPYAKPAVIGHSHIPSNTKPLPVNFSDGAMRRPDGSADLKATFPRSGGEQSSDPSVPDDVIAMNYYDWNQCKSAPTGAVVSFPIVGLDQRFDEKTGKPVVRPVTTYQGQPSDRVYKSLFISSQNVDYISDDYTKSTMLTVLGGTNLEGTWDVYYKVKHPSDNPEMTFLNILRIVPTVDDDLTAEDVEAMGQIPF